jgi:antitoxin component HigA of HigAB toxin-antitoxin module
MKFSENGNFFASGSSDKNVMIWKINDQKLLNKYLKKNEPDFLSNHLILQKNDKKTNNRLKKMVRKFKSILRIICQTKNKQGKCGLKTYLIKLFFMFDKKTLSLCFRSMKKIAFIEFFKLLTQKNENFENEYFLSNFREALKLYSHLIKKYKNIREDVKNLSIKKEISNILKKEKSKAIFTINKIKKIRTRLSFNL